MQGDANSDQDVDGADFLKWQEQTTNMGSVGAVPEPATGALAAVGLIAVACAARQRRRHLPLR
jgi:hypothetical protein